MGYCFNLTTCLVSFLLTVNSSVVKSLDFWLSGVKLSVFKCSVGKSSAFFGETLESEVFFCSTKFFFSG